MFKKSFTFCGIFGVTLLLLCYHLTNYSSDTNYQGLMPSKKISNHLKYMLIWSSKMTDPIKGFGEGSKIFIKKKCSFTNCYVTTDRQLLDNITNFDVILFHGRELPDNASLLPQSRSLHQKYVYAIMESPVRFPVCNKMYNNRFFNWTWTYKLNSDEILGYISIRDKEGKVIGPKEVMHWEKVEAMMPINKELKAILRTKKIAAAWFVSHCGAPSGRDLVVKELQKELKKYNMQVDVYGRCGPMKCPRGIMDECLRKLQTDYYFYLSFENSFADDYVTEKLLHALNNYAVPVVYGGANYTRFMPDGIYLSVNKTTISELAKKMVNAIENKERYYDFFKWHNHYSYHDSAKSSIINPICKFCASLNNEEKIKRTTTYEDFSLWWNAPGRCR